MVGSYIRRGDQLWRIDAVNFSVRGEFRSTSPLGEPDALLTLELTGPVVLPDRKSGDPPAIGPVVVTEG